MPSYFPKKVLVFMNGADLLAPFNFFGKKSLEVVGVSNSQFLRCQKRDISNVQLNLR